MNGMNNTYRGGDMDGNMDGAQRSRSWIEEATGSADPLTQRQVMGMALMNAGANMANAGRNGGTNMGELLARGAVGFGEGLGLQGMLRARQARERADAALRDVEARQNAARQQARQMQQMQQMRSNGRGEGQTPSPFMRGGGYGEGQTPSPFMRGNGHGEGQAPSPFMRGNGRGEGQAPYAPYGRNGRSAGGREVDSNYFANWSTDDLLALLEGGR